MSHPGRRAHFPRYRRVGPTGWNPSRLVRRLGLARYTTVCLYPEDEKAAASVPNRWKTRVLRAWQPTPTYRFLRRLGWWVGIR